MKTRTITSLLFTCQSISLLGIIQLATSCSPKNTDEIIVHPDTQDEAYEKVSQYLFDNMTLSLQYINALAPSLNATNMEWNSGDYDHYAYYKLVYGSTSEVVILCKTNLEGGGSTSDCLVFNLAQRINENSALYTFSFKWNKFNFGPYRTNHNIYIDYTGEGELK